MRIFIRKSLFNELMKSHYIQKFGYKGHWTYKYFEPSTNRNPSKAERKENLFQGIKAKIEIANKAPILPDEIQQLFLSSNYDSYMEQAQEYYETAIAPYKKTYINKRTGMRRRGVPVESLKKILIDGDKEHFVENRDHSSLKHHIAMIPALPGLLKYGIENPVGNREIWLKLDGEEKAKEYETFEVIGRVKVKDRYGNVDVKGISALFRSYLPKSDPNFEKNNQVVLRSIFEIHDVKNEIKKE